MKKISKKLLYFIGGFFALIIIAMIVIPMFFKGELITLAKREIEKNVKAEVNLKDFGLNLFSSFPNLRFSINDLTITGKGEFKGDTLASIKKFSVVLDLFSVIKGDKITITAFEIDEPMINAHIKENGSKNWDITVPSEEKPKETEKSKFNIALKRYEINHANIFFKNDSTNMFAEVINLTHTGNGNFTQDLFLLSTNTDADNITVSNNGIKFLNKTTADVKIDFEMDTKNNKITFKENYIKLNEFQFSFDGYVKTIDSNNMELDLTYKSNKNDFKSLLSMVPAIFKKGFNNITTSGSLSFSGFVKGNYSKEHYPAFNLNLIAQNGMFKYPDLPQAAENINIDLTIDKSEGPINNTVIDLKKFHVEFGGNPFDMSLNLRTPISDPAVKMTASGKLDLSIVPKIMPMDEINTLSGNSALDIKIAGSASDFKAQNIDRINVDGNVEVNNLKYSGKDNKNIDVNKFSLTFNPKNIELKTFETKIGNSDVHAWGYINNLISYVLGKGEILKGNLSLESSNMDLDDLMSGKTSQVAQDGPAKSADLEVFDVPSGIDFTMNTKIDKLKFDNLNYTGIKGSLNINDKTVALSGSESDKYFRLNALDGQIGLNGTYSTRNIKKPDINFGLDVKDLDIKKSAEHFVTIQKFAPVAKETEGKFSAQFKMTSNLNSKMMPEYESINAAGKLVLKNFVIKRFGILTKIAEKLKIEKYKQLSLDNASIDFEIIKGRIYIKPFTVNPFGSKMTVSGSNGLDQTVDYLVQFEIPASQFGENAESTISSLTNKINQTGLKLKPLDKVSLAFAITGTFDNPDVKPIIGGKDAVNDIKDQVKDKVNEEIEKKKQELEQKKQELEKQAQDEINKKKQELEQKKQELEKKAKEEADKKKKELEEKIKNEADKKLKDKLKKIF